MKATAPQEFKLVHRYTEHKSLKWHKQRDKQKVRDRKTWDIMALLTPDTDMHLMVLFQDRSFFMLITKFLFTCALNAPPVSMGFWGSQIFDYFTLQMQCGHVYLTTFDHRLWLYHLRWIWIPGIHGARHGNNRKKSNITQNILIST